MRPIVSPYFNPHWLPGVGKIIQLLHIYVHICKPGIKPASQAHLEN